MLNRFGFRNASLLYSPIFTPFPQIFFLFPQCHAKLQRNLVNLVNPENMEKSKNLVALLALRTSLRLKRLPSRRRSLGQRKRITRLTRKKNPNLLGERNARRRTKHQMAMRTMQRRRPRKRPNLHQRLRHPHLSQRPKSPPLPPPNLIPRLSNRHPSQPPKPSQALGLLPLNLFPLNLLQEQDLGNLHRRLMVNLLLVLVRMLMSPSSKNLRWKLLLRRWRRRRRLNIPFT